MQAAPATVVPLPYPAGMQATSPQHQQQVYPQPGQQVVLQHQLPPQQAAVPQQAQMPAAPQQQDGYGAAAGAGALHSMPLANNFNHTAPSLSGQKRDSSGAPVHGGHADGAFVKLFVGSVPRTITEDEVRPMFAEHGNVLEVAIIKDKRTGNQQGACCAVILCLWFNTCLQCKILQFISEYLSIGAHMVRMCTVFLCLALCNFVLGIVSFRQAGGGLREELLKLEVIGIKESRVEITRFYSHIRLTMF